MNRERRIVTLFLLMAFASILFMGCYRMPADGEYSVIPSTNNPDVIGNDRGAASWMPGSGF